MRTIGVCGRKGGSGKTTIAVHLAAELASRSHSVLLVDCDLQGSATHWAAPNRLPMRTEHLPIESGQDVAAWLRRVNKAAAGAAFLVLDSPPHLDAALGGVIGISDLAVVPCGPSGVDLLATGETVGLIREIREGRGGRPEILLVPNRVDGRTASGRELAEALAEMGERVSPEVRSRTAFSDAFNIGEWVGAYAAHSLAHVEIQALANHCLNILGEAHGKKGRVKRPQAGDSRSN